MIDFGTKSITVEYDACDPTAKSTFTMSLTSPAEIRGDHTCTVDFSPARCCMLWWLVDDGIETSISGTQSFLFTSANESYQLKARLTDAFAAHTPRNTIPLPYTVSSIYAPGWASGSGYIIPVDGAVNTNCPLSVIHYKGQCETSGIVAGPSQDTFRSEVGIPDAIITGVSYTRTDDYTVVATAPNGSAGMRTCGLAFGGCSFTVYDTFYAHTFGYTNVVRSVQVTYTSVTQGGGTKTFHITPTGIQLPLTVTINSSPRRSHHASSNTQHPLDFFGTGDTLLGTDNTSGPSSRTTGQICSVGTSSVSWTFATVYDNLSSSIDNMRNTVNTASISYIPIAAHLASPSQSNVVLDSFDITAVGSIGGGGAPTISGSFRLAVELRINKSCSVPTIYAATTVRELTISSITANNPALPSIVWTAVPEFDITTTVNGRKYRVHAVRIGFQYAGGSCVQGRIEYSTQTIL
jgi:hypothetical protein